MIKAFLLVVVGLSGDPEHGKTFLAWGDKLAEASESDKGAKYLAEAAAYPDDTAAIVAEFHSEMEQVRAEFLRRH